MSNHPCANKCSEFKEGRQCFYCLINETVNSGVYSMHRTEHRIDHIVGFNNMGDDPLYTITCTHCSRLFEDDSDLDNTLYDAELDEYHDGCPDRKTDSWMMDITPVSKSNLISRKQFLLKNGLPYFTYKELLEIGDDAHIENNISPLCLSDSRKNESQSPLSIKQDALSRMESCYIEQKKHVELLQTEVTRLNSTVERLKVENKILNQAASTHLKNQMHFKKLYDALVEQLYPYALSLDGPVGTAIGKEYCDGYNRARAFIHYNLLEMMESDVEYIRAQCGMLGGGGGA